MHRQPIPHHQRVPVHTQRQAQQCQNCQQCRHKNHRLQPAALASMRLRKITQPRHHPKPQYQQHRHNPPSHGNEVQPVFRSRKFYRLVVPFPAQLVLCRRRLFLFPLVARGMLSSLRLHGSVCRLRRFGLQLRRADPHRAHSKNGQEPASPLAAHNHAHLALRVLPLPKSCLSRQSCVWQPLHREYAMPPVPLLPLSPVV